MSVYGCLPEKQFYADIRAVTAALAASEARRVELEGENAKMRGLLAPVAALHGFTPPHVVIGRTVREAFFALNPQQEGSRDHG